MAIPSLPIALSLVEEGIEHTFHILHCLQSCSGVDPHPIDHTANDSNRSIIPLYIKVLGNLISLYSADNSSFVDILCKYEHFQHVQ